MEGRLLVVLLIATAAAAIGLVLVTMSVNSRFQAVKHTYIVILLLLLSPILVFRSLLDVRLQQQHR